MFNALPSHVQWEQLYHYVLILGDLRQVRTVQCIMAHVPLLGHVGGPISHSAMHVKQKCLNLRQNYKMTVCKH